MSIYAWHNEESWRAKRIFLIKRTSLLRELLAQHSHHLLFSTFLNSLLKVLGNLVIRTWKEIKEERNELNAKTEENIYKKLKE